MVKHEVSCSKLTILQFGKSRPSTLNPKDKFIDIRISDTRGASPLQTE